MDVLSLIHILPPLAGVLSAVGIVGAPERHDLTHSWPTPHDHDGLAEARRALEDRVRAEFEHDSGATDRAEVDRAEVDDGEADRPIEVASVLSCRYAGQGHEIEVDDVQRFGTVHEERNGFSLPQTPVEVIALRAFGERRSPVSPIELLERCLLYTSRCV